ncbi:hypothetical protein PVAP13_3KG094827 [Panicum virgatum]|uniref:Myb/SANT-like domain-containing protein n=1 Tax=Panicum virgatum TaxID=38727 RepID=A0A8T0UPF7_PANVG|nr:hypothetical protein PVAP13_3KG094827 [Panicum virgatum]
MQCICEQMNRCHWDPASTSLFLDLCIDEKENKFNWNKEGLTTDGWRNVHKKFRELGGGRFTDKQMTNKLQTLKKKIQEVDGSAKAHWPRP